MRRCGAVCCRWHVAVLAVLFAWSLISFFCLDLKLISTCCFGSVYRRFLLSLSAYQFILLPMYPYVCVPVFLSIYLSIYLFVCLSVCVNRLPQRDVIAA